ncbi:MAG TPA: phosphatase PAP2 family protein [Methanomicrobiales archaeon]|nr:phosphatase PAP2 family protein [Methanomicrobiales archaeon]
MDRKLLLLLVLLLVSGIALSLAAYLFGVFPFDLEVELWLRDFQSPVFMALMVTVSFLGDSWVPVIQVLAVASLCAVRRMWLEAGFVVATLSAGVLAGVLKTLVGRPRPPTFSLNPSDLFPAFNTYAYPSGHVLFFVVFYGFLAWLSWKHLTGWLRWVSLSVCAALIVLIGPSRILLGEHWVSDVIGSYIIGTFWLICLILLYEMELHRRRLAGD